ncbi:hypothetical protein [Metamycoplasma hominis]|uniref:hypothetical protein n=1 Tax=Metamycoplasma hominis TaxID=2098 RepID=UPI001E2977F4|nr:hypothetical protein [Metamycoplasma hominis]
MWNNYYDLNIKDFSNLNKEAISNNFYLIVNGENLNDLNEYIEVIIDKFQDLGIGLEKLHKARLLTFLNKLNMFGIDSQNIQEYCDNLDAKFGVENSLDNLFIYNQVIIKDKYLQINDNYVKINCLNKLPFELSDKWIKTLFSINGTCIWNNFPWNNNFANKKWTNPWWHLLILLMQLDQDRQTWLVLLMNKRQWLWCIK